MKDMRNIPHDFRAVGDEGSFEGYIVTWDHVDSYNSAFRKGSFAKTIQERGDKLKVMYNHGDLIGRIIEVKEDDKGVFVRGQLNLDVQLAKETRSFMVDGTIDALSFGFTSIKESFRKDRVKEFHEVQLFEVSPVIFPASTTALIDNVRATDFTETVAIKKENREPYLLLDSLYDTIYDIEWELSGNDKVNALDEAISSFHSAYIGSISDETRSDNLSTLSRATYEFLKTRNQTVEELAQTSTLTIENIKLLKRGKLIDDDSGLESLDNDIFTAHRAEKIKQVNTLAIEIREKLTDSDKLRLRSLLFVNDENDDGTQINDMIKFFKGQL